MLPGRVFHASDKAVLPGRPTVLCRLHADRMRTLHAPGSLSASLLLSHSNHQRDGKPIAPNILPRPHHRLPPYGSIRTAPEEAIRDGSCAGGVVPIESYRHPGAIQNLCDSVAATRVLPESAGMSSFRSAILALLNMYACCCPLATVEAPTKSAPGNDKSSGPRVCNTSSDIAVIAVLPTSPVPHLRC
jgi:hypothetical protein